MTDRVNFFIISSLPFIEIEILNNKNAFSKDYHTANRCTTVSISHYIQYIYITIQYFEKKTYQPYQYIIQPFSGETASNKSGVLQGQIDTPLNETGIQQASLAGDSMKTTQFDKVYTSDLKRVVQTASEIMKNNDSLKGNISYLRNYPSSINYIMIPVFM